MLTGVRTLIVGTFTVLGTITLGLAAGVIWMTAMLYLRQPMAWLALPAGALLAWVLRSGIRAPGGICAGLAALATLVAALWVNVLLVGVQIAGSMGLGLLDTLGTAGSGMLWQLARISTAPADIVWYIVGAALAALVALRRTRH